MKKAFYVICILYIGGCSAEKSWAEVKSGYAKKYNNERSGGRLFLDEESFVTSGLFTLNVVSDSNGAINIPSQSDISLIFISGKGSAVTHPLYTLGFEISLAGGDTEMIDDNYVTLKDDGTYRIFDEGKFTRFFPELKPGKYLMIVALSGGSLKQPFYSNGIEFIYPPVYGQ